MRDAGDGAGNDQADVGSTTFERDHEMSLANNARDMLTQTENALGASRTAPTACARVWSADRQDAGDGFPPCDTVPDMQAARGASLNASDPANHTRHGPRPSGAPGRVLLRIFAAVAVLGYLVDLVLKNPRRRPAHPDRPTGPGGR